MYRRSSNKYNARKTEYNGNMYDSQMEANYAYELDVLKKAGEIKGWGRQPKIALFAYGEQVCTYALDFEIKHNDGTKEFVEIKGMKTQLWRLKWKMALAWSKKTDIIFTLITKEGMKNYKKGKLIK